MDKHKTASKNADEWLDKAIKSRPRLEMEASSNFESRFWQKVMVRENKPWLLTLLQDIGSLIPVPSYSQVFAILLIALLVGGASGFISGVQAMSAPQPIQAQKSIEYLSGFRTFGGIPSATLAGSYLKVTEENSQPLP